MFDDVMLEKTKARYRVLFQIEPLEKEAMVVKDMYDLIEQYNVPVPPEDLAVYQVTACLVIQPPRPFQS